MNRSIAELTPEELTDFLIRYDDALDAIFDFFIRNAIQSIREALGVPENLARAGMVLALTLVRPPRIVIEPRMTPREAVEEAFAEYYRFFTEAWLRVVVADVITVLRMRYGREVRRIRMRTIRRMVRRRYEDYIARIREGEERLADELERILGEYLDC